MYAGMAENRINLLLTIGIMALIAGGAVIAFGYPHDVVTEGSFATDFEDSVETAGSIAAVIVGLFILGAGQIMFLIGAIGKGVQLGVTAAGRSS